MGKAVVTLKLMPESPDINLENIQELVGEKIDAFVGDSGEKRFSIEPVAFGLKALKILFVMDEERGGTDDLEAELAKLDGVQSVDVVDVRRTLG